jgi:hypothetical protein
MTLKRKRFLMMFGIFIVFRALLTAIEHYQARAQSETWPAQSSTTVTVLNAGIDVINFFLTIEGVCLALLVVMFYLYFAKVPPSLRD